MELPNEPLMPPRRGFPAEHIFLQAWQHLLRAQPEVVDEIFSDLPRTWDTRAARVAASFAKMLGTNWGSNLLFQCRSMAALNGFKPSLSGIVGSQRDAYIAAWAIENQRHASVNSGLRAIEGMLAQQDLYGPHPLTRGQEVKWERVPRLDLGDLDVIECVVSWLASTEGDSWVREAETRAAGARDAAILMPGAAA